METRGRPRSDKPRKRPLNAMVDHDLGERIKKIAELEQRSMSYWVNRELTQIVEQLEKQS